MADEVPPFRNGKPVSSEEWKSLFKYRWHHKIDMAVFDAVQVHYTASPIFKGMDDPLKNRIGMIEKTQKKLRIQPRERTHEI